MCLLLKVAVGRQLDDVHHVRGGRRVDFLADDGPEDNECRHIGGVAVCRCRMGNCQPLNQQRENNECETRSQSATSPST